MLILGKMVYFMCVIYKANYDYYLLYLFILFTLLFVVRRKPASPLFIPPPPPNVPPPPTSPAHPKQNTNVHHVPCSPQKQKQYYKCVSISFAFSCFRGNFSISSWTQFTGISFLKQRGCLPGSTRNKFIFISLYWKQYHITVGPPGPKSGRHDSKHPSIL